MATNTDIYVSSYGEKAALVVDTGYDLTSATSCTFKASSSAGTVSATASVLGANFTLSADGTVVSASKGVRIVFVSGAFSGQADQYTCWIQADFAGSRLISSTFKFLVSNDGD